MSILESLEQSKQNKLVENKNKLKPCTHCGCTSFEVRKATNANGMECYPYFCCACGYRSPIVEKKSIAMGILSKPIKDKYLFLNFDMLQILDDSGGSSLRIYIDEINKGNNYTSVEMIVDLFRIALIDEIGDIIDGE